MRYAAFAVLAAMLVLPPAVPAAGSQKAVNGAAPPSNDPQTVADCLQAAQTYAARRTQELRAAGQSPDYAKLTQEAADLAKQYGARFSIETVPGSELTSLARLYVLARQPDLARRAISTRLAADLSALEKATALVAAVDISMGSPVTEDGIRQAEAYAAQIDALKGVEVQKVQVHSRLGNYYRAVDVDDSILAHGTKVLDLARGLPAADRKAMVGQLASAYANVAEVYGGWEQADKAIGVLEQGLKDLADTPDARRFIAPTLERYRLVGAIGAPIEAPRWLNAPAGTTKIDPKGTVTYVQFTAHWCRPCRKSYPATLRLHNAWASKGLQVIFATELYGFLGQQRPLTADQETDADRNYFVQEHGLPFKIAIEDQRRNATASETAPGAPTNSDRYKVGGIPQIVVIDKKGKIRLIVVGWDPAAEARLNALIERLLKE